MLALVEFFLDLKLLDQRINVRGDTTDVSIVLVHPFLLTPAHHDASELGVREGDTLALHQAAIVEMR